MLTNNSLQHKNAAGANHSQSKLNRGLNHRNLSELSWGNLRSLAKSLGVSTYQKKRTEIEAEIIEVESLSFGYAENDSEEIKTLKRLGFAEKIYWEYGKSREQTPEDLDYSQADYRGEWEGIHFYVDFPTCLEAVIGNQVWSLDNVKTADWDFEIWKQLFNQSLETGLAPTSEEINLAFWQGSANELSISTLIAPSAEKESDNKDESEDKTISAVAKLTNTVPMNLPVNLVESDNSHISSASPAEDSSNLSWDEVQKYARTQEPVREPLTDAEIKEKIAHCETIRAKREPDTGKYDKQDQRIWVWKFTWDFFCLLRDDRYGDETFYLNDYLGDSFDISTEDFRYEWNSEKRFLAITVFDTSSANVTLEQRLDGYLNSPWKKVGDYVLKIINNPQPKLPNPLTTEEQSILVGCYRISRQLKIAGSSEYREVVSDKIWGIIRQPQIAPGVWEARFPKNTSIQGVEDWVAHVIEDDNGFLVKEGAYQAEEFDFENKKFQLPKKPTSKPALTHNPPVNTHNPLVKLDREPDITTDKGRFWIEPIADRPGFNQVIRIKPKGELSSHIVSSRNKCDCQGFGYRHYCCHLDAMAEIAPTFETLYARLSKKIEYCINQKLDYLFQEILGESQIDSLGSLNIPKLTMLVKSLEKVIDSHKEFKSAFADIVATSKTSEYFQKITQLHNVNEVNPNKMTAKQLAEAVAIAHLILDKKQLPKVA